MPAPRIKDKVLRLPLSQKMVGAGALLALIGAFLPWYKDIDSFNTGDQFFGVTGPLYLVGYIIIALSIFSLILTSFYIFEKKLPPLPIKEPLIYILSGSFALFLIIIANSVYFHPKFGINITSKEHQLGILLALIGAIAITIGGFLQSRESGTSRLINKFREEAGVTEDKVDPVLQLNNFQREQQTGKIPRDEQPTYKEVPEDESETFNRAEKQPDNRSDRERLIRKQQTVFGGREYKSKPDGHDETKSRSEPYPQLDKIKRESGDIDKPVNPNSVIRTDL